MSFGWLVPKCSYFDKSDMKKIVDSGIRILGKSVWRISGTEEFMSYLESFGCQISDKKVKFPKKVIEDRKSVV